MPLERLELRNEYSFGAWEGYTMADKEDPKEILEGVAAAGLIGLLRQLGDLAEFAAEVFHGLQEEMTTTTSRSHKLITRVKGVEAAVSSLEKVVLAQRTHLHFAYTAGASWQTRIRCEKNHFVHSDVPNSIMDIYEECRGPPRLQLLDRFDPGGPGSCLKRYSDPTVFKRASEASDEASSEKNVKDKKRHKIKRRRPWPRSGRVSKNASFSYNNDRLGFCKIPRMQFPQLNSDGHTSHSHTVLTCDASLRSGSGKRSTFGFENCSGRVEGDFRPSYSKQPEEQDPSISSSSSVKRHDSSFLNFNLVEEKDTGSNDNVMKSLLLEQVSCSSTSVTCDGKTGSLEHKKTESDKEVVMLEDECNIQPESFSRDLDLECLPDTIVNLRTRETLNVQPLTQARLFPKSIDNLRTPDAANGRAVNQAVLQSLESGDVHVDDIESETDQFLDALNTIESECEIEPELGSKKKVEQHSEDKGIDDGGGDIMRHNLECHSSESDMLVQNSQVNSRDNLFLESPLSPHEPIFPTNSVAEKDANNSECLADETLQLPLMAGESLTAGSLQILNLHENGKIDSRSSITSVSCTVISSVKDDRPGMPINQGTKSSPESRERAPETLNTSSATFWTNGGLLGLQPSKPPDINLPNADQFDNSKNIGDRLYTNSSKGNEYLYSDGISSRKTVWKISPDDLDIKLGKLGDALQLNNDNGPAVNQAANTLEQKNQHSFAYRTVPGQSKDLFGDESLLVSPCSSPPLQHMKISFQPINGLETFKLKLKFPHGDADSQTGCDIFPSFQLVPDVSIKQKSIDSDSDADTFCGSSPSLSNNCPSNQSDFHSEWESNESPTSKECDLYDALHRVSLMESASTASENGRTNHLDIQDKCGPLSHCAEYGPQNSVHSSDTINSSFRKKLKNDTNFKDLVDPELTPGPAPPPLPPVQWRGIRAHTDGLIEKPQVIPEGSYSASMTTQPKPAPLYEELTDTTTTNLQKSKGSSSLMLPGEREAYHDKSMDENEFLRQIRTKSFNLRPIMTAKAIVPSGASTKVPVNVLLKKANSIRQAVGSDGDEDGSWSET